VGKTVLPRCNTGCFSGGPACSCCGVPPPPANPPPSPPPPTTSSSGAYNLTKTLEPGEESDVIEALIEVAEALGIPINDLITAFALAQDQNLFDQLQGGIRWVRPAVCARMYVLCVFEGVAGVCKWVGVRAPPPTSLPTPCDAATSTSARAGTDPSGTRGCLPSARRNPSLPAA
jgi:hypothetical protein